MKLECGKTYAKALATALGMLAYAGSALAQPQPGKFVVNVRDYGAVGDGSTDDTTAIQNALNAATNPVQRGPYYDVTDAPSGVVVFFPEGVYKVTDTLSVSYAANIEIAGTGIPVIDIRSGGATSAFSTYTDYNGLTLVPWNPPLVYVSGPSSAIVASFSSNKPLFNFAGQFTFDMHDLALYGCPLGNSTARAHCTALISTTDGGGFGNHGNHYRRLLLQDAPKGVTLGGSSSDGTNSEITFEEIQASQVDTVFQPQTLQSLNLMFRQIWAYQCPTVFDFDNGGNGGGAVSVDTCSFSDCGGTGTDDWMIKVNGADNCGQFRFSGVRWETSSEQLLRVRGWPIVHLTDSLDARNYNASHPPLIKIQGGKTTVTNCDLIPSTSGGSLGSAIVGTFDLQSGHAGTLTLRDCTLPANRPMGGGTSYVTSVIDTASMTSDCYYRIDTCDGGPVGGSGNGPVPLPDAKSSSSW